MRPFQQLQLADILKEHRDRLDDIVADLVARGSLEADEARLLLYAATGRLEDVETALRRDSIYSRRGLGWIPGYRKLTVRLALWRTPRIGILRQHAPQTLVVPERYLHTTPPEPPPKISIVTPSYQQGRFLERTLFSVVGQNYPALEYVVQDGASSDESVDVIRRYEHALAGWASERDEGQADAINRGFARTSGEIMAYLNSDDVLLPGALAYVARYFAEHPDVDVVYGNRIMIDEQDRKIGAWVLPGHDDTALTLADWVPQETLFWRRWAWDAIGGVDQTFRFALDWDLLLRFRAVGARFAHVPRFLGAFRVHGRQKTIVDEVVGQDECARLRRRVHGRDVSISEVIEGLQPYFKAHVRVHNRQRLQDRLPLKRVPVVTRSDDVLARQPSVAARAEPPPDPRTPLVPRPDAPETSPDPRTPLVPRPDAPETSPDVTVAKN